MKLHKKIWELLGTSQYQRIVTLIIIGTVITRFIGINWGAPWYFHPDERNIASAVTRIHQQYQNQNPDFLNPHFFAYGTVPIYLTYYVSQFIHGVSPTTDFFAIAIIVGRVWSALLSSALVWIMMKYSAKLFGDKKYAVWVGVCTCLNVGLIQFAHYGTFEIWLTIFYWLQFVLSCHLALRPQKRTFVIIGILLGLAIGTKVTSIVILPMIYLASVLAFARKKTLSNLIRMHILLAISVIVAAVMFAISNPYALSQELRSLSIKKINLSISAQNEWYGFNRLFNPEFIHSINVEGDIARGEIPVFYTRHFQNAVPIIYELSNVFPWIMSVPFLLLSLWGLVMITYRAKMHHIPSQLLIIYLCIQLIFTVTLYVHWTRYVIPLVPALIIAGAFAIDRIHRLLRILDQSLGSHLAPHESMMIQVAKIGLISVIMLHGTYTILAWIPYLATDPRVRAAQWLSEKLPANTPILSEVYDMGIVPFNPHFHKITLFNMYELDHPALSEMKQEELDMLIKKNDVFIILSRRVWKNAQEYPEMYPQAANFYDNLFHNKLEFVKVKEFTNYPRFGPLVIKDEILAEETFAVFDRPRIQIWAKPIFAAKLATNHE